MFYFGLSWASAGNWKLPFWKTGKFRVFSDFSRSSSCFFAFTSKLFMKFSGVVLRSKSIPNCYVSLTILQEFVLLWFGVVYGI
jgi:hypothetical protein